MRRVLIWAFVLGTTFVLGCTGRPGTSGSDRSQLGRPSPSPPAIQRRIAVLDFRNTSQHKELSWLSQAVAETLVTKLAGVASIHVVECGQNVVATDVPEFRIAISAVWVRIRRCPTWTPSKFPIVTTG